MIPTTPCKIYETLTKKRNLLGKPLSSPQTMLPKQPLKRVLLASSIHNENLNIALGEGMTVFLLFASIICVFTHPPLSYLVFHGTCFFL